MSDWSKDTARKFANKGKAKQIQNAKVLHDEEVLRLKSPIMWEILTTQIDSRCQEINGEPETPDLLSLDRTQSTVLDVVQTDTGAKVSLTLLPFYAVSVKGLGKSLDFELRVINGTSDVAFFTPNGKQVPPDEIATLIIQKLLGV